MTPCKSITLYTTDSVSQMECKRGGESIIGWSSGKLKSVRCSWRELERVGLTPTFQSRDLIARMGRAVVDAVFGLLDVDGNGSLSAEQMREVQSHLQFAAF